MTDADRQGIAIERMRKALDSAAHNYLVDMGAGPNDELTVVVGSYFASKALGTMNEVLEEVKTELATKKENYEAELRYSGLLPAVDLPYVEEAVPDVV